MKVIPGIYQVQLPIPDNALGLINAYIVEGDDGWLMVDAGWKSPEAFAVLGESLQRLGISVHDIDKVVVTHAHPDHYGLAGRLREETGAIVYLHEMEKKSVEWWRERLADESHNPGLALQAGGMPADEILEAFESIPKPEDMEPPAWPDVLLDGGEIISTGRFDLEVIWTPGHSPGHICLYERNSRILFSGDHILPVITPNVNHFDPETGENPLRQYLDSLEAVKGLDVDVVLPAHEHVFHDLHGRVQELFTHHRLRLEAILNVCRGGRRSVYEIAREIPWMEGVREGPNAGGMKFDELPLIHKMLAMGETAVHLELLRKEGKAARYLSGISVSYETRDSFLGV
ncbi:MBL fold metallo-hydrolase [Thermodesulfobacteriota bacterium]